MRDIFISNSVVRVKRALLFCFVCLAIMSCGSKQNAAFTPSDRNGIVFTAQNLIEIRGVKTYPELFQVSIDKTRKEVDAEMKNGIEVPVPKDLAGGYTHERHKLNYLTMQKAGALFVLTDEEKYATYIKDMLVEYAKLFPTLDRHPSQKSYARGKLFWQCLNDANWLVYSSQAYDCIYDWLDDETKEELESKLFRPIR